MTATNPAYALGNAALHCALPSQHCESFKMLCWLLEIVEVGSSRKCTTLPLLCNPISAELLFLSPLTPTVSTQAFRNHTLSRVQSTLEGVAAAIQAASTTPTWEGITEQHDGIIQQMVVSQQNLAAAAAAYDASKTSVRAPSCPVSIAVQCNSLSAALHAVTIE